MTLKPPYIYGAEVRRVVDGDTIDVNIELGFDLAMRDVRFRLAGCNAREHDDAGGPEAADNLARLLPAGSAVLLRSVKWDKYGGRRDARIEVEQIGDLAEHLIVAGWAAAWNGRGRKPVPPWPRQQP